jgi:hypothetical protein
MPLIFGDYSINVLNGPSEINILVQNDIPNYNQYFNNNTIILFGESHTLDYFRPCNRGSNCDELLTDFILKLNIFAEHIRTEFYVEGFMDSIHIKPKIFKQTISDEQLAINQQFLEKKQHALLLYRGDLPETSGKSLSEKKQIATSYFNELPYFSTSNMRELKSLYEGCFYKKIKTNPNLCLSNNIIWQFADIRQSFQYTQYIDLENFIINYESFNDFLYLFYENNGQLTEYMCLTFLDDLYSKGINFLDYLRMLLFCIRDTEEYIHELMLTSIIQKQLSKINENIRHIFSEESFIELFKYYRLEYSKNDDNEYDSSKHAKLVDLIKLFINYLFSNEYKDKNGKKNALDEINSIGNFNDDEWFASKDFHVGITGAILDMYFILRINKENPSVESNTKLVLGYFGSYHVSGITYYLSSIIKTHKLLYNYKSLHGEIFRINITDDINLNTIMNYNSQSLIVHPTIQNINSPVNMNEIDGGRKKYYSKKGKNKSKKGKNKSKKGKNKSKKRKNKSKKE